MFDFMKLYEFNESKIARIIEMAFDLASEN